MFIKNIPTAERPRERLIHYGVSSLSNEDLLSIILKCGTKDKSVRDLSNEILSTISSLDSLCECGIGWLTNIKGIGIAKACEVMAAIELGKRIYSSGIQKRVKIKSAQDVYDVMRYYFKDQKQECFYCLYLNNKNEILERRLMFMGTVNKSIVHPREVFKYAYLSSASGIICLHNHPSGDVLPSREDIDLTKALIKIGKVQAIPILDHIIVGYDDYYSMLENLDLFIG